MNAPFYYIKIVCFIYYFKLLLFFFFFFYIYTYITYLHIYKYLIINSDKFASYSFVDLQLQICARLF